MLLDPMKFLRILVLLSLGANLWPTLARAQGDPQAAFFAAYQEFQRGERLEREGRNQDAVAKFKFVATQLSQLKAAHPDWQPLVVDFRLRKTQEAVVRLEGSLESPTLGPPPDLIDGDIKPGDSEVLPPVAPPQPRSDRPVPPMPPRTGAPAAPTVSISPDGASAPAPSPTPEKARPKPEPMRDDSAEVEKLRQQLAAEKQRSAELQEKIKRGDAEFTSVSMELERTKVAVVDLKTQLRQVTEAGAPPVVAPPVPAGPTPEELEKRAQELEETRTAAGAEREELTARMAETQKKVEELSAQLAAAQAAESTAKSEVEAAKAEAAAAKGELEGARNETAAAKGELEGSKNEAATARGELDGARAEAAAAKGELEGAKSEAEAAKSRAGQLESERDAARQEAESAKGEVQNLNAKVAQLEDERAQLIAARDSAQKEAAEAKTALEKNAELIESNRKLEEKLAAAGEQIAGMEADAAAKAKVITDLQADLDRVRGELAGVQSKLKDDRERFDKLQAVNDQLLKEYDEVTGALAAVKLGDVTAGEAKLLQQENEVLRGVIMRQIKEQARREQAYRLAQEEMERLAIKSDTLNDKINELAKPTLELTEAEQEMLKRPVITLLDGDAARMSAQVEVLKPKVDGATGGPVAAVSPAPEGVSPSSTPEASPAQSVDAAPASTPAPEASPAPEAAAAATPTPTPALSELTPESKELVAQARTEFVRGNFSSAEKLYQKVVETQPDNVVALANLGVAQFRQGKLTAAQLALERAVKANPNDAFSLTTLGAVMIEQGRNEDAVGFLERANAVTPDDPITLNYLGVATSQLGQFGRAEQSLRRAISVKPEYAEAHFNLAVIYATAKPPSIALAKRHYEKALELGAGPDKRLATMLQNPPGS